MRRRLGLCHLAGPLRQGGPTQLAVARTARERSTWALETQVVMQAHGVDAYALEAGVHGVAHVGAPVAPAVLPRPGRQEVGRSPRPATPRKVRWSPTSRCLRRKSKSLSTGTTGTAT